MRNEVRVRHSQISLTSFIVYVHSMIDLMQIDQRRRSSLHSELDCIFLSMETMLSVSIGRVRHAIRAFVRKLAISNFLSLILMDVLLIVLIMSTIVLFFLILLFLTSPSLSNVIGCLD